MKPAKKQDISEVKSIKNKKQTVPKIQSYFKSAPKNVVIRDTNNNGCVSTISAQNTYFEALKKKIGDRNGNKAECEGDAKKNPKSQQEDGAVGEVIGQNSCQCTRANRGGNGKENHKSQQEDGAVGEVIGQNSSQCTRAVCEGDRKESLKSRQEDVVIGLAIDINSSKCTRAECVQKAIECQEWEKKYKDLKKVYVNVTINYTEVDMKYKNLLKLATRKDHSDEVITSEDGIFTANEVKALQRIGPEKPKDSTFILECLQYAYKSDISVLSRRTLKGKAEWVEITDEGEKKHHAAKDPLTPEKVERIKDLYIDRISKCDIDAASYGERIKEVNLNKLFASGIKNIAKKHL